MPLPVQVEYVGDHLAIVVGMNNDGPVGCKILFETGPIGYAPSHQVACHERQGRHAVSRAFNCIFGIASGFLLNSGTLVQGAAVAAQRQPVLRAPDGGRRSGDRRRRRSVRHLRRPAGACPYLGDFLDKHQLGVGQLVLRS